MKHPQPGVGCGPCSWTVPGVIATIGNTAQAAQTLLVHAATALTNTEHTLVAHEQKDSRKDMRFQKASDQFSENFIENKYFNVSFQKLKKETANVNNSSDAIRKYYAAFPPLHKDNSSTQQYIMPAPSWCRKPLESSENKVAETGGTSSKEWLRNKNRKSSNQKIRRNSYHDQTKRKNSASKRRCHSFSKSFENEALPEWVTHEGVWDMETQDPVKEFIKALAMDEGYGTCENTMTDDTISFRLNALECSSLERNVKLGSNFYKNENISPVKPLNEEEESLAKFKAKFDRSLEALWSRDQANTPDDECQELPVDFQELLSSPCDDINSKHAVSQTTGRSIWSPNNRGVDYFNARAADIWSYDNTAKNKICDDKMVSKECMEIISDKLKPLNIRDESPICVYPNTDLASSSLIWEPLKCEKLDSNLWSDEDTDGEPSSLYQYKEVYDSIPTVTNVMRSLTTLNHNKQLSSFTEVIPKWPTGYIGDCRPGKFSSYYAESKHKDQIGTADQKEEEDLLSSMKTHFQPIKQESGNCSNNTVDYVDGMTFSIVSNLEEVKFSRSQSGTMYLESDSEPPKQYMEYRAKLTDKINFKTNNTKVFCDESENEFVLKFQVRQIEKSIQTDNSELDLEQNDVTPAKKLLLSNSVMEERVEFPLFSVNEVLKNVNQINANVDEAELVRIQCEKSTKDLWKVCDDCKSEDIWKFNGKTAELLQTDENISKIWSSDDNVCRTCNAQFATQPQSSRYSKEKFTTDDLQEWDELLSDISYMHCLRIDKGSILEEEVGGEDCYISSSEVSVSAPDGNFIKSALKFIEVPEISSCESGYVDCVERNSGVISPVTGKCHQEKDVWRCDRKRRHSATGRGAGGKLAALRSNGVCETLGALCSLPHDAPFLSCYSADRPLTR